MSSLWQGGEHITDNGREIMVQGLGGANPSTVGTMFFGTISGGAGAAISGGNFWQGAVTGMIVSGLNHTLHDAFDGDPQKVKHDPVDASKLDPKYKTDGKDWQKIGGRWTITTKKEILQWDAQHGDIEIYNKGTKTHLGSASPFDRTKMKPGKGYIPAGGWKINTSKMISFSSKVLNFIDKVDVFLDKTLFMPLPPLFDMQMQMLPGYVSPNQRTQIN